MNSKKIKAFIIFVLAVVFFWFFVWPFKQMAVDNVNEELNKLQTATVNATQQLSLNNLRLKKKQLMDNELLLLQNFIPENLHSGYFVYNLGQIANQNRLSLKGIQYTVVNDSPNNPTGEKKLMVDFTMEGRYEDFQNWLNTLEGSDTLVDVESFRAARISNTTDILNISVKMYAYGINID